MITVAGSILDQLEAGQIRAAVPDLEAHNGWRVDPAVKEAILACFRDRQTQDWAAGPLAFRDRVGVPPKRLFESIDGQAADGAGRPWRIVPGGTSIRAGAHLEPGVVVMPPAFVNIGAWIGADVMVDSHVLVGSCAQIGARVHLAAAVQIGGVLEPAGARPVIVEDDAFVGAGAILLEGVLVQSGAVIATGVHLTGTSTVYDLATERILVGTVDEPLVVPAGAVVVPGSRPARGAFAERHGLGIATALIVKYRDARTSARVALESALR
jgi:2,3,4,5-tetrahydropyridine-2-carboxylate N-succinyltransferase